jgi:hypothetical protein
MYSSISASSGKFNFKKLCYIGVFALFAAYTIGLSIYEIYTGGKAAALVARYYDYSGKINGTNIAIAIDSYPRDIYKNTKTTAGLLLGFPLFAFCIAIVGVCMGVYKKEAVLAYVAVLAAHMMVVLPQFCYCAFLTWKLHSLSSSDVDTWNFIDTGFIANLYHAQNILIASVFPIIAWCIVGFLAYVMSCIDG